jgi:Holliday junction resolvasome RuvABC endonuclease subunit
MSQKHHYPIAHHQIPSLYAFGQGCLKTVHNNQMKNKIFQLYYSVYMLLTNYGTHYV